MSDSAERARECILDLWGHEEHDRSLETMLDAYAAGLAHRIRRVDTPDSEDFVRGLAFASVLIDPWRD